MCAWNFDVDPFFSECPTIQYIIRTPDFGGVASILYQFTILHLTLPLEFPVCVYIIYIYLYTGILIPSGCVNDLKLTLAKIAQEAEGTADEDSTSTTPSQQPQHQTTSWEETRHYDIYIYRGPAWSNALSWFVSATYTLDCGLLPRNMQ